MTLQEFEHILKNIKNLTNYIYLHVKGEPLMHPKLEQILKIAESYGMKVNITTNGSLIKKQTQTLKQASALRQVNISVHSFEQGDNIGYINDIMTSITEIKKNNPVIVVYRFWALKNMEMSLSNLKLLEQIQRYYNLNDIKIEEIKKEKNIKISKDVYINKHQIFKWPSLNNDFVSTTGFCYGLSQQLAILVDGTVVPCCLDSDGIMNLGNIFNESIDDILSKEKSLNIKNNFKNNKVCEELCQKCHYRTKLKRGMI